MIFKDHFSGIAADYAKGRPTYPDSLFEFLANKTKAQDLAWDCATGNGQAALGLSSYIKKIYATDASAEQISKAFKKENIKYAQRPAYQSDLSDDSVDLITVAQALHWFDVTRFYEEADRVLKTDGLLAVWGYGLFRIDQELDKLIDSFYDVIGPHWPPERRLIENEYRDLKFPYPQIPVPGFTMEENWGMAQLLRYISTWSGVKKYIAERNENPVKKLRKQLEDYWKPPEIRKNVKWPIFLKIAEKSST